MGIKFPESESSEDC